MTIRKHSLPDTNAAIYGETTNLNYFLDTQLVADASDGVENRQYQVAGHSRRRYVGDSSPIDVDSHSRVVLYDPGRRNGTATPGKSMMLVGGGQRRSFTYTGPWVDVHAFLVGDAAMDLIAYSESARYDIADSTAAEGLEAASASTPRK